MAARHKETAMDYSKLPEDIVEKIVTEHLETPFQVITFAGVCKSWRSTTIELRVLRHRRPCFPGLLVSKATIVSSSRPDDGTRYCRHLHEFLPLTVLADPARTAITRNQPLPRLSLPHFPSRSQISDILREMERYGVGFDPRPHLGHTIERNHHVGSKDGWLVVVRPDDGFPPRRFYLLNPVTGAAIHLPPIPDYPALSADTSENVKAILTSSPDDDDADNSCHIIVLFTSCLAWCNVFSSRWQFKISVFLDNPAYFGGKLYGLSNHIQTHILCHLIESGSSEAQPAKEAITIPLSPSMPPRVTSHHLIHIHDGTDDQLLLILRCRDWIVNTLSFTETFCVYKLLIKGDNDDDLSETSWEEVRSLDGYALFLSSHQSFSLHVASNDGGGGIKDNSIYFAFPCTVGRGVTDCGIFNLETEDTTWFSHDPILSERKLRSFWFLPMPWDIPKLSKDPERVPQFLRNKNGGPKFCHYHGMIKIIKTNLGHNRFQTLSWFDSNSDDDYEQYDDDDDDDEDEVSSVVASSKKNRTKAKNKMKKKKTTMKKEKSQLISSTDHSF